MTKLEKVRKGIEACLQETSEVCKACPYHVFYPNGCVIERNRDALELLKERQWISVKDRLPESGKHVLVCCEIRLLSGNKKQYVCEAYYANEHSISEGKFSGGTDYYDYSEEDDEYYLKEGWYEVVHNWDEYGSIVIDDFVTHWMPLPEPPKEGE